MLIAGVATFADGKQYAFRFADFNPLDAVDKQKAREASDYKSRLQPGHANSIVGKPVEELNEQDFINVANYRMNKCKVLYLIKIMSLHLMHKTMIQS